MAHKNSRDVDSFMKGLKKRNPHEKEFHQAVREVATSVIPYITEHTEYRDAQIFERMTEPDRIVIFRVTWEDDNGQIRANRAWRVQFNNAIGPYKGGLRFHPTVTQSVLKFLGFEQTFKNSLTGLPMGGAKGGSNFNPRDKSDREVMRFCQSLMTELSRHIGEDTDVPAGDIGVGAREIGYLFGQYKRVQNRFVGTLTGKGLSYGGSAGRTEATGHGCVYFGQHMLEAADQSFDGLSVGVSGSGNVALYAAKKALELGGKIITLSDSDGFIHDPDGMDEEKLDFVQNLKEVERGRISEYADKFKSAKFTKDARPWEVAMDVALPCATQNEVSPDDAKKLIDNGVKMVCEGANMPTELEAVHALQEANVLFGPAKAANAGGVAVSGMEQSQNAQRVSWSAEEVDKKLHGVMSDIHEQCVEYGEPEKKGDPVDYVKGANLAGFVKVADAMLSYGAV